MKTITVMASKSYNVYVGSDLIPQLGQLLCEKVKVGKAVIISDSNVWPLYGNSVTTSLLQAGFDAAHFVFPAGESSKNAETYLSILNFLAENQITRSDLLIALGGGVVGDITGFAAATYLRGINYVQIPTSLLAMVDSSVGGKTAIDLPAGKNLVGAFCQPVMVLCDISALSTLPNDVFLDGCAEVIKYGVLYDPDLFAHLEGSGPTFDRKETIAKCISWKRDVVAEDEFDTGSRQKLNLGHTIGHGIEAQSNYAISHGQAVAAGMAIVSQAASQLGYCSKDVNDRICRVLQAFSLPRTTPYSADQLFQCALSDKKRAGGKVNLIVPKSIGRCDICPFTLAELESFIKAGLL